MVHFSKIFHKGCMDFKWSSRLQKPHQKLKLENAIMVNYFSTNLEGLIFWS